ncbi:MAG TPA: HlyD family efflux transporter periplasmic adaptor subunit [Rhodanobacter sp.]|nr:HlyD family efflux transporter periplasmic adaptor subunit [Rhodanobacter sp.]
MNGSLYPSRLILVAALALLAGCSQQAAPATGAVEPAYAAVARGRIAVEGGLLQLDAPRAGTLDSVSVHEGDRVAKGDTLATLDPEPARLQLQAAQAELKQAEAQTRLLGDKLALARQQAERLTQAAKAGAGGVQDAEQARGATSELAANQAAAKAAVDLARQKLAAARYELGLRTLRAPIAARVVRVLAQPGASVSPQSGPLFTLLPSTPPIVRAELSVSMLDAVKPGMPATVTADDLGGAQSWPAHVLRLGDVVGASTLDDDPQQRANDRTVTCVLAFDQPQQLRIGQRVLVRFGAPAAAASARKAAEK